MHGVTFARAVLGAFFAAALALASVAHARSHAEAAPSDIAYVDLPREGRDVLALVRAGGPFRYERDGVVFGNRERKLPSRPSGYYHEYTVPTPGAKTRGARRIVCGGARTAPDACFYTSDHYRSFRRIRE